MTGPVTGHRETGHPETGHPETGPTAAHYVVGDVHGCHQTLVRLLARCGYDAQRDRLWLTGDLVNRGPASLALLRWARAQDERFVMTLGNHDLHAVAVAWGLRPAFPRDRLVELLGAPDLDELVTWILARPLLVRADPWVMVHAGLHPGWSLTEAEQAAHAAETLLRGPHARELLARYYGATRSERHADPVLCTLQACLTLRTCAPDGTPCNHAGPPEDTPPGCAPWYRYRTTRREEAGVTFLFGHWAAHDFQRLSEARAISLDSGCSWGQTLTALRLGDGASWQEPVRDPL